jgi:hypothetical protein
MLPPPIPAPDWLKGIDDKIRDGLDAYRNGWFEWLLISTGVVVFGLVLELPEICHDTKRAVRELIGSCTPERHLSAWKTLAVSLGWFLIVVGVAGEFVAESFVSKADGIVQKFDETLLAEAQTKTGVAFERASTAYLRAETARMRTAGLEKEAEELHKHNLELEALIQPRDISPEEDSAITKAMERFRGKFILILAYQDPEAIRLGDLIQHALTGGIKAPYGFGPIVARTALQEGITDPMRTGVEVMGDDKELVKALKDALFSEAHLEPAPKLDRDRTFAGGYVFIPKTPRPPDVKIYVGLKPITFLP